MDLFSPAIYIPVLFILLVLTFVSILHVVAKNNTHEHTRNLPYYDEIELSMNYLGRCLLESGRFVYRKNVNPDLEYNNNVYNSLRHAGALYSMLMYEKLGLETKLHDDRIWSSKYFLARYVKPIGDRQYLVLSLPEEEGIKYPIAKSGAAGVALCALCNLYEEKELELSILRGLGEFLLTMQGEEGNIYAYYNYETGDIDASADAIFYPGEAACGWLALYGIDPQQKWLEAAKKTLMYLVRTRRSMDLDIPFDHWSVLAIEELFSKGLVTPDEMTQMRAYAEQMSVPMLSNQITNSKNSYFGAFKDNIRPGSIGTVMEGLAAIYYCTNNKQLRTIIYKSLSIGCHFLSKVQVKTGENAGGLPNSANWVRPGVTPNASIIRIDNVQHVVLGWLKYQKILKVTDDY